MEMESLSAISGMRTLAVSRTRNRQSLAGADLLRRCTPAGSTRWRGPVAALCLAALRAEGRSPRGGSEGHERGAGRVFRLCLNSSPCFGEGAPTRFRAAALQGCGCAHVLTRSMLACGCASLRLACVPLLPAPGRGPCFTGRRTQERRRQQTPELPHSPQTQITKGSESWNPVALKGNDDEQL